VSEGLVLDYWWNLLVSSRGGRLRDCFMGLFFIRTTVLFIVFVFWGRVLLCSPGWLNLNSSFYFSFLSARIIGAWHHAWIYLFILAFWGYFWTFRDKISLASFITMIRISFHRFYDLLLLLCHYWISCYLSILFWHV
jgi:hypothetical protein